MQRNFATQILAVHAVLSLSVGCGKNSKNESSLASSSTRGAGAVSFETRCVSKHIREAIELNEERLPLYAASSDGRTIPISDSLIKLEKLALRLLPAIENPAEEYQKKGIPLFCLDVVPMSLTASFKPMAERPTAPYKPFNGLSFSLSLAPLVLAGNNAALENKLEAELLKLNQQPNYNCMSRHMIESILRSVRLAPIYRRMSVERGLRDPIGLIRLYINAQIGALGVVAHLDDQAAKLNEEGIPVICNDVPYIETKLEKILTEVKIR